MQPTLNSTADFAALASIIIRTMMNEKDKIQILLEEYETLRSEILQRIGHRFAFLSLIGALGAYSFFIAKDLTGYQIFVLIISAIILLGTWIQLGNLISRCSVRIAAIEEQINSIAGEKLLKWEHEKRGSKVFRWIHK